MSETFDPYLRWLGIRDSQRPPNHYRLLGLDLFESDPDVISEAGDRQMGHVRTHQTGAYALQSQELLNELARAKVCLLNANRKKAYDDNLRVALASNLAATVDGPNPAAVPAAPPPDNENTPPLESPKPAAQTPKPVVERPLPASIAAMMPVGKSSKTMAIRLIVQTGPMAGQAFEFTGRETFTVGRSRRATFPIKGDQAFSRVHFSIRLTPPVCYLKNLNDKQGTMVNGKRVNEVLLRHGDIIAGGLSTKILVQFVNVPTPSPEERSPQTTEG